MKKKTDEQWKVNAQLRFSSTLFFKAISERGSIDIIVNNLNKIDFQLMNLHLILWIVCRLTEI